MKRNGNSWRSVYRAAWSVSRGLTETMHLVHAPSFWWSDDWPTYLQRDSDCLQIFKWNALDGYGYQIIIMFNMYACNNWWFCNIYGHIWRCNYCIYDMRVRVQFPDERCSSYCFWYFVFLMSTVSFCLTNTV